MIFMHDELTEIDGHELEILSQKLCWNEKIRPKKEEEMYIRAAETRKEKIKIIYEKVIIDWKNKLKIEERDYIEIKGKRKKPLKAEKVNEIYIKGLIKPENEIQIVDQMEIIGTQKKEEKKMIMEQRDSIEIKGKEKVSLEAEVVDIIYIQAQTKPENEIQIIDQMEILRIPRPENVMQEIEQITYYPKEKEPLKVEKLKSFIIPGIEKKIIMSEILYQGGST